MMKRIPPVFLLCTLALTACSGILSSEQPAKQYYALMPLASDGGSVDPSGPEIMLSVTAVPGLDTDRIEVLPTPVEHGLRIRGQDPGDQAFAQDPALGVTAVRVEAEADDGLAVTHHIRDYGDHAQRHAREIDERVAHARAQRGAAFENLDDTHADYAQGRPPATRMLAPAT